MRKLVGLALSLALGLTALVAIPVSADPAIAIKPGGDCIMAGFNADGDVVPDGIGVRTTVVENDNWVHQTCKGVDVQNDTGKTANASDFECVVFVPSLGLLETDPAAYVSADKSHATVTKTGRATLTCSMRKD